MQYDRYRHALRMHDVVQSAKAKIQTKRVNEVGELAQGRERGVREPIVKPRVQSRESVATAMMSKALLLTPQCCSMAPPPPPPHDDHVPDIEILNPQHYCPTRQATLLSATFALVATIVGGGILSIPLAFEKCGLVLATGLILLSIVTTDFSLYILCSVSRRTGAGSYLEACRVAFGTGLEFAVTTMLFVFLLFVVCAYMVLIRDIWTPIIWLITQTLFTTTNGVGLSPPISENANKEALGDAVLLLIIGVISPFLLKKDLHALRYNCYLGFASITLLCLSIVYRASQKIAAGDVDIKLWPESLTDVLFAYPIPILAFMCHFNMIGVQASLMNPTRERVRKVIDVSMLISGAITYTLGLFGYIWGGSSTQGNILLNFEFTDKVILAGRVGCGITIMLASAMITLPCRESMLSLGSFYTEWQESKASENNEAAVSSSTYGAVNTRTDDEEVPLSAKKSAGAESNDEAFADNRAIHFVSTFFIAAVCYIGAVAAPGVATVWSICGCMMAFIIAFILPALIYVKIRVAKKGHCDARVLSSWTLFAISVVGAIMCTVQTIWRLFML